MLKILLSALLLFFSINVVTSAADDNVFEVEADGRYPMVAGVSFELAKKMARFTAKRKAVNLAGRYLSRKSLIEAYESNRDEIYSLTAREIETEILAERRKIVGKTLIYLVRIRARVQPSDFVKAAMEDVKQNKKEAQASFQAKMEQPVSTEIDPGRDISHAYRLLREKEWRIAMIYLNHLDKKYPNWAEIHMAKALVYYIHHKPGAMERALSAACKLGNQTACDDLANIKKVHQYDFGISIID